jgi:hypothetical protein
MFFFQTLNSGTTFIENQVQNIPSKYSWWLINAK